MLIDFTIQNYRSFGKEAIFSMEYHPKHQDHPDHLLPIHNREGKALPVAALYGANGAGKSNLVRALAFLREMILNTTNKKIPYDPFVLSKEHIGPTTVEIRFEQGKMVFVYGFKCTQSEILEEWLYTLKADKESVVFERVTEHGQVKIELGSSVKRSEKYKKPKALATVGALPDKLFLNVLVNNIPTHEQGPLFEHACAWFRDCLTVILPDNFFSALFDWLSTDPQFSQFLSSELARVRTGISQLGIKTIPFHAAVPQEVLAVVKKSASGDIIANLHEGIALKKTSDEQIDVLELYADHPLSSGGNISLPFREESDGTRRMVNLLPALYTARTRPQVIVIDEIDRCLHPLLSKELVRRFLSEVNPQIKSQLIFTTHDLNFLDLSLFRRDEIWFTEKKKQQSELYSLADFKVRTDMKIDKAYVQGSFGAVPLVELPDWVHDLQNVVAPKPSLV